jgi:hypothetical protein
VQLAKGEHASVLSTSDRDRRSLEYRNAQSRPPSQVATVIWIGWCRSCWGWCLRCDGDARTWRRDPHLWVTVLGLVLYAAAAALLISIG